METVQGTIEKTGPVTAKSLVQLPQVSKFTVFSDRWNPGTSTPSFRVIQQSAIFTQYQPVRGFVCVRAGKQVNFPDALAPNGLQKRVRGGKLRLQVLR